MFVNVGNQFGLIDLPSCSCVFVCVCVWSVRVVARIADSMNPLKPLDDALMQMRHACVRSAAKRLSFSIMNFSICIQNFPLCVSLQLLLLLPGKRLHVSSQ